MLGRHGINIIDDLQEYRVSTNFNDAFLVHALPNLIMPSFMTIINLS